jgi:type II secretory pathway pseudopilin PulG
MTISSHSYRRALTLVEMLVGMAITLVMMAAVVNLFANISEGVRNRRATMEVSANLRIARARLYNDLAGATCLKYPKDAFGWMPQPDVNNPPDGYFEIVEGQFADENPPLLPPSERGTSLIPSSNAIFDAQGNPNTAGEYTDGGARGDFDDILAMTVESESERFRGRGRGLTPGGDPSVITGGPTETGAWIDMAISSPVAEVIWFAVQISDRAEGEPGMRKVYRRTLLVAPWYGTATNNVGTGSDPLLDLVARGITTYENQLEALRQFQTRYDISVRLENGRIVPNTLADLSRRENRFMHLPNDVASATPESKFPHPFPYNTVTPSNLSTNDDNAGRPGSSVQPFAYQQVRQVYPALIHDSLFANIASERDGEDLVLNEVLAFDVQVFDPGAPLYQYGGSIIPPSSSTAFIDAVGTGATNITGFGAYVDLGWNNAENYNYNDTTKPNRILAAIPTAPAPLFQQERRLGWHPGDPASFRRTPAVYDTWSTYYESDQVNQDDLINGTATAIDQGTNGLDEPAYYDTDNNPSTPSVLLTANGPDDPLERETSPPYPYALRGVQVKLRIYEPESRQIRETTVTRNLVK